HLAHRSLPDQPDACKAVGVNPQRESDMPHVQLTAEDASAGLDDGVVVHIPAHPRHLRIVRMVAATYASDAGYSIDDVDDVRMAADEVCAAVLEQQVIGPVTVTFRCSDGQLTMSAEA